MTWHVRIEGPGKISWGYKDVDELARALIHALPKKALDIILDESFAGTTELVKLEHALARPTYKELRANYLLLKPIVRKFPEKAQWQPQHFSVLACAFSLCMGKRSNAPLPVAGAVGFVPDGRPTAPASETWKPPLAGRSQD